MHKPLSILLASALLSCLQLNAAAGPASEAITAKSEAVAQDAAKPQFKTTTVTASSKKTAMKPWTIMVFMNNKNNLFPLAAGHLGALESVGSTNNMNVVAQAAVYDGPAGQSQVSFSDLRIRRYVISKDGDSQKVTSEVAAEYKRMDLGDYKNVVSFVKWAKENYPAQRYLLSIYNHGLGFMDPKQDKIPLPSETKGISFDDETGNYITTPQLNMLLSEVGGVDLLMFHACLMSAAEVMSEVGDKAKTVVASEDVMLDVVSYAALLEALDKNPSMPLDKVGKVIAKGYMDSLAAAQLQSGGEVTGGHLTVANPKNMKKINAALKAWTKAVMSAADTPGKDDAVLSAIQMALQNVPRYTSPFGDKDKRLSIMGDLGAFVSMVNIALNKRPSPLSAGIVDKGNAVLKAITKDMLLSYSTFGADDTGTPYKNSTGISIYLPPLLTDPTTSMEQPFVEQTSLEETAFAEQYSALAFAKDSGWGDFVSWLYKARPKMHFEAPAMTLDDLLAAFGSGSF